MTGIGRGRDSYPDVGARTRQSIERAIAGGATPAELAVLLGVIYWTTTWSVTVDRKSLGKIAAAAGMWDGALDDTPRWLRKRIVERLRRLEELGAVTYTPGRGGLSSTIGLPPLEEGSVLWKKADDGNTIDARRGALTAPLENAPEGSTHCSLEGSNGRSPRGAVTGAGRGALTAPPREDVSRTKDSRTVRAPRARDAVGSLASLLTERTTTDRLTVAELERVARHVAELVLDRLPELDGDVLEHATAETIVDPDGDEIDAPPMSSPVDYLARLEYVLGDHAAAVLTEDPRRDALVSIAYVIADAVSRHSGRHWTKHLDEALDVETYLESMGAPDGIVTEVLTAAARGELRRPMNAADLAWRSAREIGLDWSRCEREDARR